MIYLRKCWACGCEFIARENEKNGWDYCAQCAADAESFERDIRESIARVHEKKEVAK